MDNLKLTQREAERLINMVKYSLVEAIKFPNRGESEEFNVCGSTDKDIFTIKIYKGKINRKKYSMNARISKNGTPLLELHIGRNAVHQNPDGQKVIGNHWRVYTEEHGRRFAFPADSIDDDQFVENTISFLNRFHVIKQPDINCQLELS